MILNHLNLPVTNVAGAVQFFEQCFGFKCREIKGDHLIAILGGINDFELVLMSQAMNLQGKADYPGAFHIGFMVDTDEDVYASYEKIKAFGISIEKEPKAIRGNLGFYFYFEEIMIEVGRKA